MTGVTYLPNWDLQNYPSPFRWFYQHYYLQHCQQNSLGTRLTQLRLHSSPIKYKRKRLNDIVYSRKCKKSRASSHFFFPLLAGGLSAVLSLPPDPNGGMPAVLRISSPGPCFCRSIWLASFNSRVNPQETKTHWIDMIPFGVQLFLPRAPNLFFHFRELSVGAVRRGERRLGLVSSQSVSTAAAGCLFAPRSIQPHWFRGRKRVALSYLQGVASRPFLWPSSSYPGWNLYLHEYWKLQKNLIKE